MISQLVIAVVLTIGVSALCSILEAMILSLTTAEVENFKKRHPSEEILSRNTEARSMRQAQQSLV